MSIGFVGYCILESEDSMMATYKYSGANWNVPHDSEDELAYDGVFRIKKSCLIEPEIHNKTIRKSNGKKVQRLKRIIQFPDIVSKWEKGDITIEQPCKRKFLCYEIPFDYIAYMLLINIFEKYQEHGFLPEKAAFMK